MNLNFESMSSELSKLTKNILIDIILKKSVPEGVKLSDDLHELINHSLTSTNQSHNDNTTNVAQILKSVTEELKNISQSNRMIHNKLNSLEMAKSTSSSFSMGTSPTASNVSKVSSAQDPSDIMSAPAARRELPKSKFIVGSGAAPRNQTLAVAPQRMYGDIFVSRLCPQVSADVIKSELFSDILDVTITRMVTKHPTYASFHVRLPIGKLDVVLQPEFWPSGIMVKRFWGRLLPDMVFQNSTIPKN